MRGEKKEKTGRVAELVVLCLSDMDTLCLQGFEQ